MSKMTHDMLSEFTDEDRWLVFFTKKTFATMGISGVLLILGVRLFSSFGIPVAGWVIGLAAALFLTGSTMIHVPGDNFLRGSGMSLDQLMLLRFMRKKNACIYVKGYIEPDIHKKQGKGNRGLKNVILN